MQELAVILDAARFLVGAFLATAFLAGAAFFADAFLASPTLSTLTLFSVGSDNAPNLAGAASLACATVFATSLPCTKAFLEEIFLVVTIGAYFLFLND